MPRATVSTVVHQTHTSREMILDDYRGIHKSGVLHQDVSPRHWYLHPRTGKIQLIDFGQARVRSSFADESAWLASLRAEIDEVKTCLGLL